MESAQQMCEQTSQIDNPRKKVVVVNIRGVVLEAICRLVDIVRLSIDVLDGAEEEQTTKGIKH